MRITFLSVVLALAALVLSAVAQARTITDTEVRELTLAFINALKRSDIDGARRISDVPFLAEDDRLLVSEDEFDAYFREALAIARPDAFPNQVLVVRDFEGTRHLAGPSKLGLRDQVMRSGDVLVVVERSGERGVVLIGDRDGEVVVNGFGSCDGDAYW